LENKNIIYDHTDSVGTSVHIHTHYKNCKLGAGFLGEKGIKAEEVGRKACSLLRRQMESGACLDEWMADQILPYMALVGSSSATISELTKHAETNIWVIEKFLPVRFSTTKVGKHWLIECVSRQ